MEFPKISVVVPSFNQARYIETTLLSIITQNYPNLELIVIDGGSSDGSVDKIKKYQSAIKYWVSEPDGGQTPGLIKGFQQATGDIQCWINSDDLMAPGCLKEVSEFFLSHPDVDAVFGDTSWIDEDGVILREQREIPFNRFIWLYTYNYIPGMSMYWRRNLYEKVGGLDPQFNLAMDADLWIRFSEKGRIGHISRVLSSMRFYPEQKNVRLRDESNQEEFRIRKRYWSRERDSLLLAKKLSARAFRILWKLTTGCYSTGYHKDLNKYVEKG